MANFTDFVQLKTVQGTAVQTPHHTLIPESQALIIKFPYGGFVWQRPTAVLVQQGEQTRRYPITDVTRLATWSVLAASLLVTLLLRLLSRSQEQVS
ncbi:MAG: hypothetical protein CL608_01855 [Anaerolineaceae bacterium]|nr:hypothetical protein [Anaerolineaceae bacterium]